MRSDGVLSIDGEPDGHASTSAPNSRAAIPSPAQQRASAAKTAGAGRAQARAVTGGFVCCKLWLCNTVIPRDVQLGAVSAREIKYKRAVKGAAIGLSPQVAVDTQGT